MNFKYRVYDDGRKINDAEFDSFREALAYAKKGGLPFVCEVEFLENGEEDERIVWSWDDVWDDEKAIAEVEKGHGITEAMRLEMEQEGEGEDEWKVFVSKEGDKKKVEAEFDGSSEEVKEFVRSVFGDHFDLDFGEPCEEVASEDGFKPVEGAAALSFDYQDFPEVSDYDRPCEKPNEEEEPCEKEEPCEGQDRQEPESPIEEKEEEEESKPKIELEEPADESEPAEEISADGSPRDMIDGKLVPAKDPNKAEVEIEDEEDLDDSICSGEGDLSDEGFYEAFGKEVASKKKIEEDVDWNSLSDEEFIKEFGKKIKKTMGGR